jgi:hypothetical protein
MQQASKDVEDSTPEGTSALTGDEIGYRWPGTGSESRVGADEGLRKFQDLQQASSIRIQLDGYGDALSAATFDGVKEKMQSVDGYE